jgi:glycerophosphoryl diester phosphodiesterase
MRDIRRRRMLPLICLVVLFVGYQHFYGGVPTDVLPKTEFDIVAHRGVHQNFERDSVDRLTGCEAVHITPLTHIYIENTLDAIGVAFQCGATIVELDVRQTADGVLVVFHDDRLECRTDGTGSVGESSPPTSRC